jgi:hypothetical protein
VTTLFIYAATTTVFNCGLSISTSTITLGCDSNHTKTEIASEEKNIVNTAVSYLFLHITYSPAKQPHNTITNSIMTGSEILNVVVTVGVSQLVIDLLSNHFVFKGNPYQRALQSLERSKTKLEKAKVDAKKNPNKNAKKLERATTEYQIMCADVARRHFPPSIFSSIFFFILLRILGTEYKGKVIGVMPFVPFDLVTRITCRGLDWRDVSVEELTEAGTKMHPKQAISFLFVYVLAGLAVKFYISKAVGTKPPAGADNGIRTVVDSPMGQAVMRSMGIDPEELKMD